MPRFLMNYYAYGSAYAYTHSFKKLFHAVAPGDMIVFHSHYCPYVLFYKKISDQNCPEYTYARCDANLGYVACVKLVRPNGGISTTFGFVERLCIRIVCSAVNNMCLLCVIMCVRLFVCLFVCLYIFLMCGC